jgi:hypothetical protein
MADRYVETRDLEGSERRRILERVEAFVEAWKNLPSLAGTGIIPSGSGTAADILALDYVIYENLYSLIGNNGDFVAVSSAVFGNCLVNLLKFEWCLLQLPSGPVVGVSHPYNDLRVPLEAVIANHLSGKPQYENFAYLLADTYISGASWPIGHHFLAESYWLLDPGEYEKCWGFSVPPDVSEAFLLQSNADEDLAVRLFGLHAYDWEHEPSWANIRRELGWIDGKFNEIFGHDWKARVECKKSVA